MSEHFSKLNKFSQSFSARKPMDLAKSIGGRRTEKSKPIFTVGDRDISGNIKEKSGSSSDDDDDDDNENIEMTGIHAEKPINFCHDKHLMEGYTPSIGIIMGVKNVMDDEVCDGNGNADLSTIRHNNVNLDSKPDMAIDALLLIPQAGSGSSTLSASPLKTTATTPEITVFDVGESLGGEDRERMFLPSSTLSKNFSHSTGEVDNKALSAGIKNISLQTDGRLEEKKRSASEQDLTLNITSSQSESAIRSIKENIANVTSPVASTAKDILSPFSKLAKGVQTLGANLDPRKLKSGNVGLLRNLSEHQMEERHKLQEKWANCQTKLIAL